jgi:hypothetical protein
LLKVLAPARLGGAGRRHPSRLAKCQRTEPATLLAIYIAPTGATAEQLMKPM